MAAVQRYVDTASAGGDGTTQGHSGSTAAYASLSSWESSEQADLVSAGDTHTVSCAGSTADSTAANLSGWTTSVTNFITIEGDRSAPDSDGFYDGNAVISTGHYRLTSTSDQLLVEQTGTVIDGIQFHQTGGNFADSIDTRGGVTVSIRRCRMLSDNGANCSGVILNNPDDNTDVTVDSCLIVGFGIAGTGGGGIHAVGGNFDEHTLKVYNCTLYGNGDHGIRFETTGGPGAGGAVLEVKNTAVHTTGTAGNDLLVVLRDSNGTATYDTNGFEDSESTTNEVSLATTDTNIWTSPGVTAASTFDLVDSSGTYCDDNGISIGETNDITDTARATPFDIGAFAFTAAAVTSEDPPFAPTNQQVIVSTGVIGY